MAWIYLLLVILVFYTPVVGLGSTLLQMDWELSISGLRVPIPFTGTFWLLLWSLALWWALWALTRWVEKRTDFDIFYWLDQRLPFLHLRERWIYATRPPISIQLAVVLAGIGVAIALVKLISVLLLSVLLAVIIPQLLQTAIPGLIKFLLKFPGAGWVEPLVGWLNGPLTEWLVGNLMRWLYDALDRSLGLGLAPDLFVISLLIIAVKRSYEQEQYERYRMDVVRTQRYRKWRERG